MAGMTMMTGTRRMTGTLAERCREEECSLPWCYCSRDGTNIPAGLQLEDTPQMVLVMIGER